MLDDLDKKEMAQVLWALLRRASIEKDQIMIKVEAEDGWWEDEEKYVRIKEPDYDLVKKYKGMFEDGRIWLEID